MAATLPITAATPAAAYRPLYFEALRVDPDLSDVTFIRPATSGDVTTLGSGLAVGDILVQHTDWDGSVAVIDAGWVLLSDDCLGYAGVHRVLNSFDDGTDFYTVIESADFGALTFGTAAHGRVYLNEYTVFCKVSIYTDPSASPVVVYLQGTPNNAGKTGFYIDKVVRNYFNNNIEPFAKAIPFGLAQNAHGVTALFYKVSFAEVYDSPGEIVTDPFDGGEYVGSEVFYTDTDYRVAVNAVHPASEITEAIVPSTPTVLDWSTAGLNGFQVGGTLWARRFLTLSPRRQRVMSDDHYRLHMLTSDIDNGDTLKYTVDYTLRVYDFTNGTLLIGDIILQEPIALAGITTAAFSIGVGPADLAGFVTLPAKYAVMITNDNTGAFSEIFTFEVDSDCKEVKRSIAFLNPLGGVDSYTFTARELDNANDGQGVYTVSARGLNSRERKWLVNGLLRRGDTKTLSKYYDPGTGYDYTERPYSGCIAVTRLSDTIVAPVIIETTKALASSTGGYNGPLTIDFRIGRDQTSQQG
jgi:hypothetical protein